MIVEFNGKVYEIEKEMDVKGLLRFFSLNSEAFLVVVNGEIVTEDKRIKKEDKVKIIKVISGG